MGDQLIMKRNRNSMLVVNLVFHWVYYSVLQCLGSCGGASTFYPRAMAMSIHSLCLTSIMVACTSDNAVTMPLTSQTNVLDSLEVM